MSPPDSPPIVTSEPHVRRHQHTASVLTENGGGHLEALQQRRAVAEYVELLLLNVVRVDDIVGKDLQPTTSGNHHRVWLDENERVVAMKDGERKFDIAPYHASLEV